jgi:hypothetical protein
MTIDFEADSRRTGKTVGDNSLAALSSLADDYREAENKVARLEKELKEAKAALQLIAERHLPDLMEELDINDFSTGSGLKITMGESISAKPRADRRAALYKYLEDHGEGGMIKRTVEFAFGVNKEDEAQEFLKSAGRPGKFVKKVEPSTLSAYVRAQLEEGTELPLDLFGVFRKRVAKVSMEE